MSLDFTQFLQMIEQWVHTYRAEDNSELYYDVTYNHANERTVVTLFGASDNAMEFAFDKDGKFKGYY